MAGDANETTFDVVATTGERGACFGDDEGNILSISSSIDGSNDRFVFVVDDDLGVLGLLLICCILVPGESTSGKGYEAADGESREEKVRGRLDVAVVADDSSIGGDGASLLLVLLEGVERGVTFGIL